MENKEMDYSKCSREELLSIIKKQSHVISMKNSTIEILSRTIEMTKKTFESIRSSNELYMKIINSGTLYLAGRAANLTDEENDKEEHKRLLKFHNEQQIGNLEQIAFDSKTPDKDAKKAQKQLLKLKQQQSKAK